MKPLLIATLCVCAAHAVVGQQDMRKFYDDDPLLVETDMQNASTAVVHDVDLFYEVLTSTFATPRQPTEPIPAMNVNTVDEVPDSNWFTNRVLARPLSESELALGPSAAPDGPATGSWAITAAKSKGFAPGFTIRDGKGTTWFIEFDADGHAEGATGALLVANRLFHAIGYWQAEQHLAVLHPDQLTIEPTAVVQRPSGARTRMTHGDVDDVLRRAERNEDGSYRVVAARLIAGKVLGNFTYQGTRPDDPNDVVPHQHRRELRALQVFGAWTNLVDMKAGNTLDALVTDGGRSFIRHYLQDVGSTFGIGANGPHRYDEGFEYLYEGDKLMKRLVSIGFYRQPWQSADYEEFDSIGRFESEVFDPTTWRSRLPNSAALHAQAGDTFWAARRVMAFSDQMIRAIVASGRYSDPQAAEHFARTLMARRDKIGRAYLPAINPIVNPAFDGTVLTFDNAAVAAGVAPAPGGYRARWARFDNQRQRATAVAETTAAQSRMPAPAGLPSAAGEYIQVELTATDPPRPAWAQPLTVYFRRVGTGWKLVGLERSS
jgi:hypothetical protein